MCDGILARMKPDTNYGETAARLCQRHMEAGNSLATASTHRGQYVTRHRGWTCARSGECRLLLLLLLLLLLVVARRGLLLLFRCLYSARIGAAATHKSKKPQENSYWLTLISAVTHE